jgi:hypothetical protein
MSYKRHQAVDLVSGSGHTFTGIPTCEDMLFTMRGVCSGSGSQGAFTLRPNGNATSGNYRNVAVNALEAGPGGTTVTSDYWWLGAWGGSFPLVQGTYRLTKSGDLWLFNGSEVEGADPPSANVGRVIAGAWDGVGAIVSSLAFSTILQNANLRLTGRIELWYQDA